MTATAFPKNPYIIGRPIYDSANFYGREEIFQFIEDNLENEAQVILLFGQRRIGKTSILHQIPQAVNLENFVFAPLSLQGKGHKSLGEVLFELATDIKDSIQDYFKTSEVDISIPSVSDLKQNSSIFVDRFLAQIYNLLNSKNLVLLIDEFDVLEDTKKDSAINQFFPYLYSMLPKQKQLYIIPVVGRRLDDMPTLLGLFKDAPYKQIGLLDKYDAKQLICKPTEGILNYDANVIQAILDLSAGHPYFTQLICFAIFGRLRQQQRHDVTKEDVVEIVDKAIEYGEGGLAWFYDGLTKPERLIFSVIAEVQKYKNTTVWQFLKQQKVAKSKSLITANKQLLSWEFIKQEWEYIPVSIQIEKITAELVRLWLLKRHPAGQEIKSYQTWLWQNSLLRRYLPGGVAALTLILGGAIGWWYSPWGQIQQTRWDLVYLSDRVSNNVAINTAVAFAKDNKLNQSRKILQQALNAANLIENSGPKAWALRAIAEAYGKLGQNPEGIKILEQALDAANQIEDSASKAMALRAIAEAYGKLGQNLEGIKILEQVLLAANQIEDSGPKVRVLRAIAETYGKLGQNPEGIKILEQVLLAANQIEDSYYKAEVLSAIAEAYGNLGQNPDAIKILEQALLAANQIEDSGPKAWALSAIAEAYGNLGQNPDAIKILEQALLAAKQIEDSRDKAGALRAIAQAYGNLGQNPEAINLLQQALDAANQIQDSNDKASVLRDIAQATGNLEQNPEVTKIIEQTLNSANQIEDFTDSIEDFTDSILFNKTRILKDFAVAYAKQGKWYQARKIIDLITVEDIEAQALAGVLTIWAENKNSALVEQE